VNLEHVDTGQRLLHVRLEIAQRGPEGDVGLVCPAAADDSDKHRRWNNNLSATIHDDHEDTTAISAAPEDAGEGSAPAIGHDSDLERGETDIDVAVVANNRLQPTVVPVAIPFLITGLAGSPWTLNCLG
jgi:hypothetical protein